MRVTPVLLSWLMLWAHAGHAMTARELLAACSGAAAGALERTHKKGVCAGYISALIERSQTLADPPTVCPASTDTLGNAIEAVTTYMQKHPLALDAAAPVLVEPALQAAYACH